MDPPLQQHVQTATPPPDAPSTSESAPASVPTPGVDKLLDVTTFQSPLAVPLPRVVIEYCDRCRWAHRAQWTATELFLTFAPSDTFEGLRGVTLIPRDDRRDPVEAGRWRIWVFTESQQGGKCVWDRKVEGGFGDMKEVKKRVRDLVGVQIVLGHSEGHKK